VVVGFNRPFSQSARWLLNAFGTAQPRMMLYRVNAGFIPPESWVHDPAQGGGRLLGEGCHFLDFLRHVAGASAETVQVETPASDRVDLPATGNFAATIRFANGSVGQLLYSAQGAPGMPKEYFECFAGQACGSLHDYRAAEFFQGPRRTACARHAQDKGQAALLDAFLAGIRSGGPSPMRPEDILESSVLTLAAQQSLLTRQPVQVSVLRTQLL
jgi:polar amino acid transport system substrate-binding protein